MERVSSILAEFRLNFGDDAKTPRLSSRDKCLKSIDLVDSLLLCSQQQIDQFLSPTLESLLKLSDDASLDVRQAASDALNRLTGFLPENLLTKLRYLLFKHLQHSVNQPQRSVLRLKVLLKRFSNLADSIKPIKCLPFAQYLVPIMNLLLASCDESLQGILSVSTIKLITSLGHVFTESDSRDLQTTLIAKLQTPLLSLSCRQCASEVLVAVTKSYPKLFPDTIDKLSRNLNSIESMDTYPAILLAVRLLIIEVNQNSYLHRQLKNVDLRDFFDKLINLTNDDINYMGLLSILELVIVMLKNHCTCVMYDVNPLTAEVIGTPGAKRLRILKGILGKFIFTGEKGKMLPDTGTSRVSIKSNIVNIVALMIKDLDNAELVLHDVKINNQRFDEIFMLKNHRDHGLRSSMINLCSALVRNEDFSAISISILMNGLHDESSKVVCKAVKAISNGVLSSYLILQQSEDLVHELVRLTTERSIYFAVKIELISCFGNLEWRYLNTITWEEEEQVRVFFTEMITSSDHRLRNAALLSSCQLLKELFGPRSLRNSDNKLVTKFSLELDSILYTGASFDQSIEYAIELLASQLLTSVKSFEIDGLSSCLLSLLETYPTALAWRKLCNYPSPPLIGYLVQLLEMHSAFVDWPNQNNIYLLASRLVGYFITDTVIQKRFLTVVLNTIGILKQVFTEKKVEEGPQPIKSDRDVSSPTLARRFRKLLPGTEGKKEVSELPAKSETETLQEEICAQELFAKLTTAYQSWKLKEESGSSINDYFISILRALQHVLPALDFSLTSKYGQEILSTLQAIYEKTFDAVSGEIINTVVILLQAVFNISKINESPFNEGIVNDFVVKALRPFENFKRDIDGASDIKRSFLDAEQAKRSKSSSQDYIRWFEPFVNVAMKRYTVTANSKIQFSTLQLLRNLIKLRVNYSLLDHDGIFLRVLKSQIECSEKLLWRDCDLILPSIFSFLVSISDDAKNIIQRNEIITLLSTLMASGLDEDLIIANMEPILHDVFDQSKQSDLEAEREMILAMLLKMINNSKIFDLIIHIVMFYNLTDQMRWRSISTRVSEAILSECLPLHHQCRHQASPSNLDKIRTILYNCSNGSLIQNEKMFFEALNKGYEAMSSALCNTKQHFARICISLISVLVSQQSMRQIVFARKSSSTTSFISILKLCIRVLNRNNREDIRLIRESIMLIKIIADYEIESIKEELIFQLPFLQFLNSLYVSAIQIPRNDIDKISMIVRLEGDELLDDSLHSLLYAVGQKSERTRRKVESASNSVEYTKLLEVCDSRQQLFFLSFLKDDTFLSDKILKTVLESRNLGTIKSILRLANKERWKSAFLGVIQSGKALKPVVEKIKNMIGVGEIEGSIENVKEHVYNSSSEAAVNIYARDESYRTEENFTNMNTYYKTAALKLITNPKPFETIQEIELNHMIENNRLNLLPRYKFMYYGNLVRNGLVRSFKVLKESSAKLLIDDLASRYIARCSDDKISDLVEYIHSKYETSQMEECDILTSELLSLISYHEKFIDRFRKPRHLSSLGSSTELEDSNMLRQVIFRFQWFGFGNRNNFLQLWTSLQQLICAQSITGLQIGEGGEEETEVACLAVRGLQSLCLQSAAELIDEADEGLFGSPLVTKVVNNSRCPSPRLLDVETRKRRYFAANNISAPPFLGTNSSVYSDTIWMNKNVEEIGSSIGFLTQINSARHFRKLGISPTITIKNQEIQLNPKTSSYWRPDIESSVQFLFDLFLRWIHFTQVDSQEKPNHRILIETLRSLSILVNFYPSRQHFHETNNCLKSMVTDVDPLIQRLILPIITKCSAIAGFDHEMMESTILPILNSQNKSFILGLFHLIDTPAGLVHNFEKIIRKFIDYTETTLIRTNPSWLSCSPYQLESKILQFSAALFLIEKFADYAEEAGFTQNVVNYIIRAIRFGLPLRAIEPFVLGVCRLIWLGHLVPAQLHKLAQAGGELCSAANIYLAQSGVTLISTVILYLNLIHKKSVSFMDERDAHGEIANQFQSTISLLLNSIGSYEAQYGKHVIPLIYNINKQLNKNSLNKLLIEFVSMKREVFSIYSNLIFASFSIKTPEETEPNQWVILSVPNIIQIDSIKRIIQILSVLFISSIRSSPSHSLLAVLDYKISYDVGDSIDQCDWIVFTQLAKEFLEHQNEQNAIDFCNSMKQLMEKKQILSEDAEKIQHIISP